jgi:glycosyltransferase involved in cell wall biosynthesis
LSRSEFTDGIHGSSPQPNVLIVEGRILEYRRGFFERLETTLASVSIRASVVIDDGSHRTEKEHVGLSMSVRSVRGPSVSIAGRQLTFRRMSRLAASSQLVIVDPGLRHIENYPLLLRQRRGPKVALWGHGRRYVKGATRLERFIEHRASSAAHWYFAYTQPGADYVAAGGFPRDRITVVQNTIDVNELAELRRDVTHDDAASVRIELDLPEQNVCLFVGELDAPKRISFLLEACSMIASRIPNFTLIVAGDGKERGLIEASLSRYPWLRYAGGPVFGKQKAQLGAVSRLLLMPGRVGLVAVDSFALLTPIVTTTWPYHAPEFDYLEDGVNARIAADSVSEFAGAVHDLLIDHQELERLREGCRNATTNYTLDTMVTNFADGVIAALKAPRRRRKRPS